MDTDFTDRAGANRTCERAIPVLRGLLGGSYTFAKPAWLESADRKGKEATAGGRVQTRDSERRGNETTGI